MEGARFLCLPASLITDCFRRDKVISIRICDIIRYHYDMFWLNFNAIMLINGVVTVCPRRAPNFI